jgi:hypothetical protein
MLSNLVQASCSWKEVLSVLVERHRHASIGQVKSFLHSVSVMNIDIEVKNSRVNLQKL